MDGTITSQRMIRVAIIFVTVLLLPYASFASTSSTARVIRPSYPSTELYDYAIRTSGMRQSSLITPTALIVNHHLLAIDLIVKTFRQVRPTSVRRIVLISPNHFAAGPGMVTTTDHAFITPYGPTTPDRSMISAIRRSPAITVQASAFSGEHGIFGLLPLICREFPHAQLVPIIVKDGVTARQMDDAFDTIMPWLGPGTLVIGSFDFSHDKPLNVADAEDARSLAVLRSSDVSNMEQVSVDSRPGLAMVMRLAVAQGARRFTLVAHGNSARYVGALDAPATTSYLTGYFRR